MKYIFIATHVCYYCIIYIVAASIVITQQGNTVQLVLVQVRFIYCKIPHYRLSLFIYLNLVHWQKPNAQNYKITVVLVKQPVLLCMFDVYLDSPLAFNWLSQCRFIYFLFEIIFYWFSIIYF